MSEDTTLRDQAARDAAAKVADYEHGWSADIETEFADVLAGSGEFVGE